MDSGVLPRRGLPLPTSSLDGGFRSGWSFPPYHPAGLKMPSARLIKAVLATIDSWLESLAEIERSDGTGARSQAMHLRKSMLMSKLSFIRLSGGTEEEIQMALAQANEDAKRSGDEG